MQVSTHNSRQSALTPNFESRSWPQVGPAQQLYQFSETTVTKTITGPFSRLDSSSPGSSESQQYQEFQARPYVTQHHNSTVAPPDSPHLQYSQSLPAPYQSTNPTKLSHCSPPPIPGFFVEDAQKSLQAKNPMAVFGADYVADVMECFYLREKPVVVQPGDGVIKMPGPAAMQFNDGFKIDVIGHGITEQRVLRDLPSRDVICCQRKKKAAISATVMICAGSVADDRNMVACVRKTGEHQAMIDMEKRGQVQYAIEGDLVQRNYKVMKNGTQVAQVMRDDNARAAVTSKHSYCLQVAPQTDCALMIAAAMAIEDIYRPK
ncbi:TPA: hypothetical protein ACH3X1_000157 [Trebouxia sp. C0004]